MLGLAENRAKERRTLSIGLLGQGKRPVGFSYVVAAPVWKTSYRLVLPKEGGKARLQGWGVVENLTGSDWKDVELSLISGNPGGAETGALLGLLRGSAGNPGLGLAARAAETG